MTKPTPFTAYQWKLFLFLSVATFFEGYDFIALTQILPSLRQEIAKRKGEKIRDESMVVHYCHCDLVYSTGLYPAEVRDFNLTEK